MVKQGYKQTDVGVIPEDWDVATLVGVCSKNGIVRGPFGGALKKEIFVPEGYKVYEQGNAIYRSATRGKYYIDSNKYNEMLRFAVDADDFIVSCSGTIGMIYKIPKNAPKGIINQALLKLSINQSVVDSNYFYLYFSWENFNKRISDDTQGGAIKNLVCMELFKKTWLLLPSLPEQELIAAALSDVDSMISSLEKLIEKKKAVKQGAMQELLTGKKRLPGFAGEWTVKYIDDIATIMDNCRIPVKESDREKMAGNIPYCGANGIVGYINGYTIDDEIILIAEDGGYFDEYATRPIAYKMSGKCWVNNHAHILKSKSNTDQNYLFYCLVHKDIRDFISSGTRSKLNKAELLKITIQLPLCLEEQIAIASILSDMDNEIESLEQKLEKTRQIKQGMMQQLLTGKIRLV